MSDCAFASLQQTDQLRNCSWTTWVQVFRRRWLQLASSGLQVPCSYRKNARSEEPGSLIATARPARNPAAVPPTPVTRPYVGHSAHRPETAEATALQRTPPHRVTKDGAAGKSRSYRHLRTRAATAVVVCHAYHWRLPAHHLGVATAPRATLHGLAASGHSRARLNADTPRSMTYAARAPPTGQVRCGRYCSVV